MRDLITSFEFHRTLESPLDFARREWRSIVVFGGAFAALLLIAIFAVDPSYFYPRLQTDALYYYLKGLAFAESGNTAATTAINGRPLAFVSLPGVLRSPLMFAFGDFDQQLRAIQVTNVPLVAGVALLNAYIVSWVIPRRYHWAVIGVAFASILLSPTWLANVFVPLADAPFALFCNTALVILVRLICAPHPAWQRWLLVVAAVTAILLASFVRFTGPLLLAFAAALWLGRARPQRRRWWLYAMLVGIPVAALATFLALNLSLARWYLEQPVYFLMRADKAGIFLNLFALAIPSQIIPELSLAYSIYPTDPPLHPTFMSTPADVGLVVAGLIISGIVVVGLWHSRHRFMPEILYLLFQVPIVALLVPSTPRYLLTYQALIWLFFLSGLVAIESSVLPQKITVRKKNLALPALLAFSAVIIFLLRSERLGTASALGGRALALGETRGHSTEVASTFRDLRRFLETLPRDRTLLISPSRVRGRWKAIAGLDYYYPDRGLRAAVERYDVYFLIECPTLALCNATPASAQWIESGLAPLGMFRADSVFARATPHARVAVYRLRSATKSSADSRNTPEPAE